MNCENCGKPIPSGDMICPSCGAAAPLQTSQTTQQEAAPIQKPENVVTGTVGALIGAAIGAGSIILLGQLGYIASISGLILAICTLKGYELLGGRMTVKGIVISLIFMLVTPYIADRLDWAIVVMNAFDDVTLADAFAAIPMLIEEEAIDKAEYIKNLLMLYGFVALGAVSTVANVFKKKK